MFYGYLLGKNNLTWLDALCTLDMMKVTVLYNLEGTSSTEGISEADDDTGNSARAVCDELIKIGYNAKTLGISPSIIDCLKNLKTDFVFNLVEWTGKEYVQSVKVVETLEKAGLPYSGSRAWGIKLTGDKYLMKKEMEKNKIPTPGWSIDNTNKLRFPVIVKPTLEHCGIGISQTSVCKNENEAKIKINELIKKYKQPILVEEFIDGKEAHVTIIEKNRKPYVMYPAVFAYKKKKGYWPVMSYEAKWQTGWETTMSDWEDERDERVIEKIKKIALECYTKLGGRSYPRVDMRIRGQDVYVLEINNNPGIGWDMESGITYSCVKEGMNFSQLLKNIIDNAQ